RIVGKAHRQVAIASRSSLVDQDLLRAVHRLQAGHVLVRVEHEHVVLVEIPMARLLPELAAHQARSPDFIESPTATYLERPVLERPPERHSAGVPEGRRRGLRVEGEEVELSPELAMVALLGLFQAP